MVSPMHWSIPYLRGMSFSKAMYSWPHHFDAVDDVVCVPQNGAALGRGVHGPVLFAEMLYQHFNDAFHGFEPLEVDVHEGDISALFAWDAEDVVEEAGGEGAARS